MAFFLNLFEDREEATEEVGGGGVVGSSMGRGEVVVAGEDGLDGGGAEGVHFAIQVDALEEVVRARDRDAFAGGAEGGAGGAGGNGVRNADERTGGGGGESGTWARELQLPVLVIHGTEDELIPVEQGRAIYGAIPGERKAWMEVATGRHGNVLVTPDLVYARMAAWFLENREWTRRNAN